MASKKKEMAQMAAVQKTMMMAQNAERKVDQAIEHMDNMSREEMEDIRKSRRKHLEQKKKMREEWLRLGHGKYEEIADEKAWFEEAKTNKHLITHFYRSSTVFCQILDNHLRKLAAKHIETRFVKIDAEKCNYLVNRLRIQIMPTIIMTQDNFTEDRLDGFFELGNTDKFTTEELEERLAKKAMIDYEAPPPAYMVLPGDRETANKANKSGKAIYESAKQRMLDNLADDDSFLDSSDDEGADKDEPVSTAVEAGEDAEVNANIWK